MSVTTYKKRMKEEKQVEELEMDTIHWDTRLQYSTEEINFLKKLLSADVFTEDTPSLEEFMKNSLHQLEELRLKKMDLQGLLHNHREDLLGMRECEDISCEMFYNKQHQDLIDDILVHFNKFQDLKSKVFRFVSPKLRDAKVKEI